MHELLQQAVTILAAAVAVILVCARLRIPSVVGFLLTGILIGPSGLALVHDNRQVEIFAEIGVVFLLFAIGLEFSLERLRQIRRFFFLGGSLQAVLTLAGIILLALLAGFELRAGTFFGFLVVLSSTAVVLKLYADRREMDAPQGKVLIGILLFQDFLIVPMIVLTPVLAGTVEAGPLAIAGRFLGSLAVVALVFAVARYGMPRLLRQLVRTGIREVLVLAALVVCLGMALLTEVLGFSLALGAFIAGIIISESEYSHQVVAEVVPFRDVFNSLFFISVGMLLDVPFALARPLPVLGLAAAILAVKAGAAAGAVALLGFPARIVILVALGLAQVGEFSFVLLEVGQECRLIDRGLFQVFIAASILTLLATPVLVGLAPAIAARFNRGRKGTEVETPALGAAGGLRNHVVVIGFGVNGRNLARVLKAAQVRYVVVELDSTLLQLGLRAGEPMIYGDATRREILEHAGVPAAGAVVFGISDLQAVRRAIPLARDINPDVYILVRTRLVDEIEDLRRRGADEVVAQELETSIEIFTRVLERYHVPRNIVRAETRLLRAEGYRMMRAPAETGRLSAALVDALTAGTTDVLRLDGNSAAVGKSLRELDLRKRTGASLLAVVREGDSFPNPAPDFRLEAGDDLVLMGGHGEIERAFDELERKAAS
ncbi:MAG TPA: cation:proton antiporter [Thermoanaerobaculia bacterium]|nr:cation:proton antiporter [Thermoanaerobaculia bacterium]